MSDDSQIDDDNEYASCEDCRHLVSGGLYDCPDDVRRCHRCFDRAAEAYCKAKAQGPCACIPHANGDGGFRVCDPCSYLGYSRRLYTQSSDGTLTLRSAS